MEREYIKGLPEALKILADLEPDLRKQVAKPALKEAAEMLAQEVKKRTPVRTGNLRDKIITKALRSKKNGTVEGVLVGADIDKLSIGSALEGMPGDRPAYYLVMVENGYYAGKRHSRSKHADQHTGHNFIPGQRFLEPAFEAASKKAPELFKTELVKFLDKKKRSFNRWL